MLPLTLQLARREIAGRYRGSVFGAAWLLINPLVMLLVYGFVLALVLRARWPGLTVVHRLDLETSGILLAAKDYEVLAALQAQFELPLI